MKTTPYCGAGEVPKGRHRGSMIECMDLKKVNYWGLKKVDPKIFESVKLLRSKDSDLTLKDLRSRYIKYTAGINKLRKKYKDEELEMEKKRIKDKAEKLNKEIQKIVKLMKIAEKKEKEDKENEKSTKSKKSKKTKKSKKSKK